MSLQLVVVIFDKPEEIFEPKATKLSEVKGQTELLTKGLFIFIRIKMCHIFINAVSQLKI